MSYDITCSGCGHRNPMGRLYCMQCGARLEVSERTVTRSPSGAGPLGRVIRGIRLLVTLSLLAMLIQLLRPVIPMAAVGGRVEASEVSRKLEALQEALLEGRAVTQRLAEAEINAYLIELLAVSGESSSAWFGLEVRTLQLRLEPDRLVGLVVAERGFLRLSQEIVAAPRRTAEGWSYEVTGMRMGHLPLPRPVARLLAERSAGLVAGLNRERDLIKRLAEIRVGDGAVEAVTQGS